MQHSSFICGHVINFDTTIRAGGLPWPINVDTADYCGVLGDSGGAVFSDSGAVGIHVTVMLDRLKYGSQHPCLSSFVPIDRALSIFRRSIPSLVLT